ncbi:alanine racemase [Castellaniella sp.]|uniref:alanine racemase n=1 Tax=Castellaniella sp. TaxID=1955812 RepID=UPI00355CFBE1
MSRLTEPTAPKHGPHVHAVQALIDPKAIAANLRHLHDLLAGTHAQRPAPGTQIWAVVKADAYGHGLHMVYPGLREADGLAVFSLQEALACRRLGWTKPLLIMGTPFEADGDHDPGLFPVHWIIDDWRALRELGRCPPGRPLYAWLRFRGQLNHGGFGPADYRPAYRLLAELVRTGHVRGAGHLCHYACAEDPARLREERQYFAVHRRGLPGPVCTENSAALLLEPEAAGHTHWARSGIALYGISPLPDQSGLTLGLQPAMRLQAPLRDVLALAAGARLGYGGDFLAPHDMQVGLVGCGYAYGYPRQPGPDARVLVGGQLRRIIGRVTMDTLAIDVTGQARPPRHAPVTLWGDARLPIEHVAHRAGMIPAQLCTGLTARVLHRQVA